MARSNSGIYHTGVGDIAVTALNDGVFEGSLGMFVNTTEPDSEALLKAARRPNPPRLLINCYLLQSGGRTVLVDTGAGAMFGPVGGGMHAGLDALGIAPSSIDMVLLTHAHLDHVGGLIGADGTASFPNAELVISEAEHAFWHDDAAMASAPEERRGSFSGARSAIAPYAARLRMVKPGGEPLAGVRAVDLVGHTPGHIGWMVASGAESLLIWGDIVHVPAMQFTRPEIGVAFDADVDTARATRLRVLDMLASDGHRVAGMHHEFPPFGHVMRDGSGYRFATELWAPEG